MEFEFDNNAADISRESSPGQLPKVYYFDNLVGWNSVMLKRRREIL